MTRESEFFKAVAARKMVRPRVAGIIVSDGQVLVQRPSDNPAACYALIGGEYEVGDTFASRLPVDSLAQIGLRPRVVRDAIMSGTYLQVRHLVVPQKNGS